jgi:transcriptional regulator with XRE-family HTH domain
MNYPTGVLLLEQRQKAGISQARLSELSGVPERTIRRLENEEAEKPQSETIRKLAKALGCRYAGLLGLEFDRGVWEVEEISYDPTDDGGLSGRIYG